MHTHDTDFRPSASLDALKTRAALLRRLRNFFDERGFIEVETPLLSDEVIPERHIEPIRTSDGKFLQASPELFMKRLLAAGATSIYQVTRSFRAGERGRLHNPEFAIVEWYRVGDDMAAGMNLLDELAQTLLDTPPAIRTTYADAFRQYVGLCPHTATLEKLASIAGSDSSLERDELLNLLLATCVEPHLGRERPEIIYHYPATQASLSKIVGTNLGYDVAERFELYYRGVELANGFHELTDAAELRRRFEQVNVARAATGRPALPLPESLLSAMTHGLPDSAGCALGLDRLAMLSSGATSVSQVMPFAAPY
jgi:lysyl-tRNA synthetase class 2